MSETQINLHERLARTTGRALESYEQFLGFNKEDLEDRNVLNLGAGKSNLNAELDAANIHPHLLVNVDYAYRNLGKLPGITDVISEKIFKRNEIPPNAVVGDIKNLPFAESSFDDILYLWSLTTLRQEDKTQAINEAFRVAREGGQIKIYPVSYNKNIEDYIKQLPFITLAKPKLDFGKLTTAGMSHREQTLSKIRQFMFNLESFPIDLAEKCLAAIKDKRVGTLTIKKPKEIDEKKFSGIIAELEAKGCIL